MSDNKQDENNARSEKSRDDVRIEAYGVKGLKSTPWRKTFKNCDAMTAWVEKNDAVVHAMRDAE